MVLTLTPELLAEAAAQLSHSVHVAGCEPVALLGIQSGGAEVARLMRPHFPKAAYAEIRLSRPSTKQKGQGMTHRLLQHLPLCLCDWLRIAESRLNEWRGQHIVPQRLGTITLSPEIRAHLTVNNPTLLLIDDAIDTGATIQEARRQLLEQYPSLDIRVAVITVTTPHPLCEADFALYRNRTLCRFPWSNDYRK